MAKIKRPPHPAILVTMFVLASLSLFIFLVLTSPLFHAEENENLAFVFDVFFLLFLITYCVFFIIFMYRLWVIVQDSSLRVAKPSPGKAVDFLFIPFYNFYWLFIVRWNCARHINHFENGVISEGLVIAECILLLALSPLGLIIQQINNFRFYRAAKEILRKRQVDSKQ